MDKITKKDFILEGLDCSNCAAKIEKDISELDGVNTANIDFISKTLSMQLESTANFTEIKSKTIDIVKKHEPDVSAIEKESGGNSKFQSHPDNKKKPIERTAFFLGALIFTVVLVLNFQVQVEFVLFSASYLLVGGKVVLRAFRNISRGQIFDENFLMSVATIGAFAIGEFPEGVAVMLFYQIGEFFQGMAVNRSRKSITALMDIRPDFANLKAGSEIRKVSPYEVSVGDTIIVKPGEKVPLDGIVTEGKSTLDVSALTGESLPKDIEAGSDVLSGSINKSGVLTVRVTKEFEQSTVSKILDLVQNASSKKAVTENFITKFARYYTPFVVLAAVFVAIVPPVIIPGATFSQWINRALSFLVVSCPCALVISIPLSFFGGIGGASRNGILVKGSNFLEALNNVDTVVFDKTGTLTKGVFNVTGIESRCSLTQAELLQYAACAESFSNHPIALSIQKSYGEPVNKSGISDYEEVSGYGIKVNVKGKAVIAGNNKLMEKENIACENPETPGTTVHLAIDGIYAGYIIISDEIKPDSKKAISDLRASGVRSIIMLTGDSKAVGEKIGNDLGLDQVYTELLPHQKVEKLELLDSKKTTGGNLVFVGDGINDAPVLARADIGIAMGGLGSDAAIEAADVVLMTDEPSKLLSALKIAGRTRTIVWQNIVFAIGVKVILLLLVALGTATMWEAVFGDVGVAIIAILNAMRVMKADKTKV